MKATRKKIYHIYKRYAYDAEVGDPPIVTKALVLNGTALVTIRLTEAIVREAISRNGQGDGQNCAGAVCVTKHKKLFGHDVLPLVDWWRNRVYLLEGQRANGQSVCRVYAHYDNIEELFDTEEGLKKLLRRIRKEGYIDITLYPLKKGKNSRTGEPIRPGTPNGESGEKRRPRKIGTELRVENVMRSRPTIPGIPA